MDKTALGVPFREEGAANMLDEVRALLHRIKVERDLVSSRLRVLGSDENVSPAPDVLKAISRTVVRSPEFEALAKLLKQRVSLPSQSLDHFLKWSGAYHQDDPTDETFVMRFLEQLERHLEQRRVKVRYLLSLPWLDSKSLPDKPINGGWFQLRTFSASDLEDMIRNDIRRTFFPSTELSDTTLLCLELECWLLVETEDVPGLKIDWSWIDGTISVTDLPEPIQDVLGALVLYQWKSDFEDRSNWWPGFPQGTRLILKDSWFESPDRPVIYQLAFDIDIKESVVFPLTMQFRCCDDLATLPEVVRKIECLGKCEETAFVRRTVIPFLVRAALTETSPASKRDQFLSHVTAIEALVGSPGLGVKSRVARRLGILVSPDNSAVVARQFARIWDTRSGLVHGATVDTVDPELSWAARELAATAARHAIDILHHYREHGIVLTREEFCGLLDALALGKGPKELAHLFELWPEVGD